VGDVLPLLVQSLLDALTLGSIYGLLALGLAMVFSIMNLVNFAYGGLIMVGAYTVVFLSGLPWPVLVVATFAVVIGSSVLMERIAFRPVRGAPPETLLVISFSLAFVMQTAAILFVGGVAKSASLFPELAEAVSFGGFSMSGLALFTIGISAVILVGLGAFLTRTSIGLQMRAAADDFTMARILGVRADRVISVAFAISGGLATVASLLLVAQSGNVSADIGTAPVIVAFVAIVVGGMGSLRGAVAGGYFIGVITVLLQTYLPLEFRYYRDAFVYTILIAVLLVRPTGLFVVRARGGRVV
jgi:branched-chain amino acid transport system permease protein